MDKSRSDEYLSGLVREFLSYSQETEWLEFKGNNSNPEEIGEYISALANSAVLCGKSHAYVVWGVDDQHHTITGTTFVPSKTRKNNQDLENWLLQLLNPKIYFQFFEVDVEGKLVVILEIKRAFHQPVQFRNQEFIRVGSYKKKLKDFTEKERKLWQLFDQIPFEEQTAFADISSEVILQFIDYPAYFDLLNLSLPENRDGILSRLCDDGMITKGKGGKWNITNLGAILFAKDLDVFKHLKRKSIRVIQYKGNDRIETIREQEGMKGYACGFEGLITYINNLLPTNEVTGKAFRKEVPMYPEPAIRELAANAIIHQDFNLTGTGPMIEIFRDRMEITNPGKPLVDTERFLDCPPKSRNESLASFLRRIGLCEERGSGIDKVVFQTELFQLPAPIFEVTPDHTRVVLFAHKPFNKMDKEERIHACYLHGCLKFVNRDYMTNASLRERFGVDAHNYSMVSRVIRDTIDAGKIRPYDPQASKKLMRYVPYWA